MFAAILFTLGIPGHSSPVPLARACRKILHANWTVKLHNVDKCISTRALTRKRRLGLGFKSQILVNILLKLNDSKEAVYGALDTFAAQENKSLSIILEKALIELQKKQQWHRIIQVLKWKIFTCQSMTMENLELLLSALDKDYRAEEAHVIWESTVGNKLHSIPSKLGASMICIYRRNKMYDKLVKLFEDLETNDWEPPDSVTLKVVSDTYELLGLQEKQEELLRKYQSLHPPQTRK